MAIQLARNLTLPPEAQTQTFALLAIRGVGKTYTCLKMAEGMHDEGHQFVMVDPTGVCWGLRSSADGKSPGLPILIFGGEHGDVPLEPGGGALVADFIVDERVSCVLDLSDLRKGQSTKFMCEFAERLYHRKRRKRDPLHIFMDEADAFAPQKPLRDQARMLGAVEDLVRRGRSRGIGLTLATQRSAVLNKDVLTQCETLIAMCVVAPQDIKAVDEWLKHAGDEEGRQRVKDSLPSMEVGEAWVWSPRWLKILKRIKVLKRDTFDSSATPKAGKRVRQPKTVADVDLDAVRGQMAGVVERAEASDPKKLKGRIRELEKELEKARSAKSESEVDQVTIDEAVAIDREHVLATVQDVTAEWPDVLLRVLTTSIDDLRDRLHKDQPKKPPLTSRRKPTPKAVRKPKPNPVKAPRDESLPQHTPAKQRILDALAFLADVGITPADRTQLALFADTSPKSSGYANNLGALRTSGLIDYPAGGKVGLTDEGRAIANNEQDITTEDELHTALARKLPNAKWRIVKACIDAYPNPLNRDELAEKSATSPSSSGYANNLGSLRSLGLIDYPARGQVVATDILFLQGV